MVIREVFLLHTVFSFYLIAVRFEFTSGTLAMTLAQYRLLPRVYIGCMKSGPVLAQK